MKILSSFDGFVNSGARDSFSVDKSFTLHDLDKKKMLPLEYSHQDILSIASKYNIPYLGVC
ncbi:MAG: hypothetical protein AB8U25_05995 [Rickettsiales endosymbiont of Dermacentor nuttalli]